MAAFAKTSFSHISYATFRPTYPASLYNTVLSYHRGPKSLCIDLGCGHGPVTRYLSKDFKRILGTDPSPGMISQAKSIASEDEYPNVEFRESTAESMPFVESESVDLVIAGQAAHWFDQPRLWPELRRVLRKGGTIAFFGYKDHVFVDFPKATKILHENSWSKDPEALGYYWQQPGRSIVESKLRAIKPPTADFEDVTRIEYEPGTNGSQSGEGTMFLTKSMKPEDCKEYARTWSSYHGWKETHPNAKKRSEGGEGDIVDTMFDEMAAAEPGFEDPDQNLDIEWGSGLLLARRN